MIKQLTALILSLGFLCAYAYPTAVASAAATSTTTAATAATTTSTATVNASDSTDTSAADATAQAQAQAQAQVTYDETAPMIFQIGKQKLLVNKTDVASAQQTITACYDGILLELTQDMGNQLQNFTSQNINQPMKIQWNNVTLGDEVLDAPLGSQLCLSYVEPDVQQALLNEFANNQNTSNSTTNSTVKN